MRARLIRRRRGRVVSDLTAVAAVAQRLAVLLEAGVPAAASWGYLEEGEPTALIARRVGAGESVPLAIAGSVGRLPPAEQTAWRGLAAAWWVAAEAGASFAPTLRDFAAMQRDVAQSERDIAVALASPVATARLVVTLPPVGILFGYALGFDTISTLIGTPLGWACLFIGAVLLAVATAWNRRLVRSARPPAGVPGLALDLTAIALAGGGSPDAAVASVTRAMARFGLVDSRDNRANAALDLSRRAGVPAAVLLRSEAAELRRVSRSRSQERAQRLSVRLMLPLGLCVLPAFMVLGVVPLLIAIVGQTSFG